MKALAFTKESLVEERFEKIQKFYSQKDELLKSFLIYFENSYLKGKPFTKKLWNYANGLEKSMQSGKYIVSKNLFFTNNFCENANLIINSMIGGGRKLSIDKFEEILNLAIKKIESREKYENKPKVKMSDLLIFLGQCGNKLERNLSICI